MRPSVIVSLFALVVLAACGNQAAPAADESAQSTAAAGAVAQSIATAAPSPTAILAPSATPTATTTPEPTATATPTATPTATSTPTPQPMAVQITTGGCCTQPFWSPDSQQVRFIDKPADDQPVGIWGVAVDTSQAAPVFVTDRLEESTALPGYLIETTNDTTIIERRADGERWTVPAGGRTVFISPNETRIAWTVTNSDAPSSNQVSVLWLANLDGSDAQQIATLPRGGLSGWISDDVLLISGRESLDAREQILYALSLADGSRTELARAERIRGQALSPSGGWLVYYITFDADAAKNGLWLAKTDGSQTVQLDDELFGAYQWRNCLDGCSPEDDRLLVVPFQPDAPIHWLVELNPATGEVGQLTDPEITPFKIANGDWRVSPDGQMIAFVENNDRNIWILALPER